MPTAHPFVLHGADGVVTVDFRANGDPAHWGYGILGLPWPTSLANGLPVLTADVSHTAAGYATVMGWIQVVRITVSDSSTSLVAGGEKAPPGEHAWVDGPPNLRGLGVPFVSFGPCPTLFDAPASTESDIRFVADSFLTASRDGLISRSSRPCLGVRWGYETRTDEEPSLIAPSTLERSDWHDALPVLREGFPDWTFEDDWAD
jgi:hypothetical protein